MNNGMNSTQPRESSASQKMCQNGFGLIIGRVRHSDARAGSGCHQ
jgi:hypothetical protein